MRINLGKVHPISAKTLLLISLLVCMPWNSYAQSLDWENKITAKARFASGGFRYIPLQEIAESLNVHTYYSNKVRKAVLYLGVDKITVSAYNPFVLVGKKARQMPINTKYSNGDILVPIKFFLPILREVLSDSSVSDVAVGDDDSFNITGVSVEEKENGTLIRVKILRDFDKSGISTRYSRRWLYIDILKGILDEHSFQTNLDAGLVKKVVPVQQKQMAQLSFQLTKDISGKEINVALNRGEILISIPTKDKLSADLIEKLKSDREKWKIDRIVIDPGHGGKDPGAIGPSGVFEKDVVLAIGKRLKRLLEEKLRIQVFMTRDSDRFISLKERTQFANKKEGKLFISIHANWNPNRRVRGTTTYFLGLAKSEEALEIAQRENAVIKYEENGREYAAYNDESIILATMAQNAYNIESQDFASIIQASLKKHTGLTDRGVKQAGFYVLVGASMPNILVEMAFISNRAEEKLLKKSSFQQKAAEGIYRSVKAFKEKHEKTL